MERKYLKQRRKNDVETSKKRWREKKRLRERKEEKKG